MIFFVCNITICFESENTIKLDSSGMVRREGTSAKQDELLAPQPNHRISLRWSQLMLKTERNIKIRMEMVI